MVDKIVGPIVDYDYNYEPVLIGYIVVHSMYLITANANQLRLSA